MKLEVLSTRISKGQLDTSLWWNDAPWQLLVVCDDGLVVRLLGLGNVVNIDPHV